MDRTAWVALSLTERIGTKTLRALLKQFDNDLDAVLRADEAALREVPGIGAKMAQHIRSVDLVQVAAWLVEWEAQGITLLTLNDAAYPAALLAVADAPPTLFVRGTATFCASAVAIVGRRSPSPPAREIAYHLGVHWAQQGYTIVSGLARGIDTAAHQGALSVAGGATGAVLGCGVNQIYPPENEPLAAQIMQHGALVSEVAPFAPPSTPRLVARNRIISGLCEILIVVETEDDGGAMHAAKRAREQGRRVCVVDLPVSGNQQLLREGAEKLDV